MEDIASEKCAKFHHAPKLPKHDSKVDGEDVTESHVIEQDYENVKLPVPVKELKELALEANPIGLNKVAVVGGDTDSSRSVKDANARGTQWKDSLSTDRIELEESSDTRNNKSEVSGELRIAQPLQ